MSKQLIKIEQLLEDGQWQDAELEIKQLIQAEGKSFEASFCLTKVYLNKKDFAAACEAAEQIIQFEPDDEEGYLLKAKAFLGLNQTSKALREIKAAERLEPNHPEIDFLKANAFYLKGDWEKAYQLARKAFEFRKDSEVQQLYQNACAKLIEQNLRIAEQSLANDDFWSAYSAIQENTWIDPSHLESKQQLKKLLPQAAERSLQQARSAYAEGNLPRAWLEARQALRMHPDFEEAKKFSEEVFQELVGSAIETAKEHFEAGRWQEAIFAAYDGLSTDPENETLLNYKALAEERLNPLREA
ncbi:Hypothetical protein PBC10988_19620 [Planctomycetales bacterium 10988]|nr:Hypothetical protein PBC10988_19620 [Planctomycetales bacterium 10988]